MKPRGRARACLAAFLATITVCAATRAADPPQPTPTAATRPARTAVKFEDWWIPKAVLHKLGDAVEKRTLGELRGRIEAAILARVSCQKRIKDLEALTTMVYVLDACKYLPKAHDVGGAEYVAFLVANRPVSRRLFRALSRTPRPEYALTALLDLMREEKQRVRDYPDLAVAFAIAQPFRHYRTYIKPASTLDSFRWYTDPKVPFRYNLRKMPFELSSFLADSRMNVGERKWGYAAHHRDFNPAGSFFRVRYDWEHFARGKGKKIADLPYTLPNLRKFGGVCIDQAYYAAEVCKALGVPATIVSGTGRSGIGHAWVAALRITDGGKRAYWDCDTGRYKAHRYYSGALRDPILGAGMLDCELMLAGMAAQLPLNRREGADAAFAAARLVEGARRAGRTADLAAIEALASHYNTKVKLPGDRRTARTEGLALTRPLDAELVQDLLATAAGANLAHRPTWDYLIQLRRSGQLPVEALSRFFTFLTAKTAPVFPEYGCEMILKIVPTLQEPDRRVKAYQNAMNAYGKRPDLRGRMLLALGDDFLGQGLKTKALRAYELAATECRNLSLIVLPAARKAEKLLLEAKRIDLAIRMYDTLYGKAPRDGGAYYGDTARYQLGLRLSQLLHMAGRHDEANRVTKEITPRRRN